MFFFLWRLITGKDQRVHRTRCKRNGATLMRKRSRKNKSGDHGSTEEESAGNLAKKTNQAADQTKDDTKANPADKFCITLTSLSWDFYCTIKIPKSGHPGFNYHPENCNL